MSFCYVAQTTTSQALRNSWSDLRPFGVLWAMTVAQIATVHSVIALLELGRICSGHPIGNGPEILLAA